MRNGWPLAVTLVLSLAAFLLVGGWLLSDPGVPKAEALKTGGLAGAAIVALYALWINDRRRRTEEARHEVERGRADTDRERIADERFAKAVELLGHDADQVRVGALHVLANLARDRPRYTQTVLDVLCAYLRRPFIHPAYEVLPADPDRAEVVPDETWPVTRIAAEDGRREVRRTAHRLISDLLPPAADPLAPDYDLDLSDARLEYLDLTGRRIGRLTARRARLHGITRMSGMLATGPALFSWAHFYWRTEVAGTRFDGGLSLRHAELVGAWETAGTDVRVFADLRTAAESRPDGNAPEWADRPRSLTVSPGTTVKLNEPHAWTILAGDRASEADPAMRR